MQAPTLITMILVPSHRSVLDDLGELCVLWSLPWNKSRGFSTSQHTSSGMTSSLSWFISSLLTRAMCTTLLRKDPFSFQSSIREIVSFSGISTAAMSDAYKLGERTQSTRAGLIQAVSLQTESKLDIISSSCILYVHHISDLIRSGRWICK